MKKFAKALMGLVVLDCIVGPVLIPMIVVEVDRSIGNYKRNQDSHR